MSDSKQPPKLTGLVRTTVKESNKEAVVYMGQAGGFLIDGVSYIVVANTTKDLTQLASKLKYEHLAPQLIQPVALMHESFVTLRDDEL